MDMSQPPVTRQEFEDMKTRQAETQALVKELHDALMLPQPGQKRSLLERMAAVTIGVETGTRTARATVLLLGFLAMIGVSVRFGFDFNGGSK
jgi:hypothetical protein